MKMTATFDVLPPAPTGSMCTRSGTAPAEPRHIRGWPFEPGGRRSRAPRGRHAVLLVKADGSAETSFETDRFTVDQLVDADGSAMVVHAGSRQLRQHPAKGDSDHRLHPGQCGRDDKYE